MSNLLSIKTETLPASICNNEVFITLYLYATANLREGGGRGEHKLMPKE